MRSSNPGAAEAPAAEAHPYQYPVRCAVCGFLYYPDTVRDYLCDVCQASLEDYEHSMAGSTKANLAWWQRQHALRAEAEAGRRRPAREPGSTP